MPSGAHQEKPIRLFYSYSHRDEAFRGELEAHLSFLRRSKLIVEWHDRMIGAGGEWKGEIDRQLATADIILLLVSADFIASDYCWGEEMKKALVRHQLDEARVIPVILRPCRWQRTPLGSLQALPKDGKPVSEWPNHDVAFEEIAVAIERTIAYLQQQRRYAAEQIEQEAEEQRRAGLSPAKDDKEPSDGAAKLRLYAAQMNQLRPNLALLGVADLYAFLGMKPCSSSRNLRDHADGINKEILRIGSTDPESNARKELCGACLALFRTDAEKQRYGKILSLT